MGMATGKTGKSAKSSKSSKSSNPSFKKTHMKKFLKVYSHFRVSANACSALASFLSLMTQEVLQSSLKQVIKDNKKTIKPKHINSAIRSDSDLRNRCFACLP